MIARGELPAVRLGRNMLRVEAEDVEQLVHDRREIGSAAAASWGAGARMPAGTRWWSGW
jgi:hypothetical protein